MSKAILVLEEMPKDCMYCMFSDWATCRMTRKTHLGDTRPEWCPLEPLPEKAELTFIDHGQDQITMGWNACIDKILRRGE